MELTHIAARDGRLSSFLNMEMRLSSGLINRLKRQSRILVNGSAQYTDFPVRTGDCITVLLDEPVPDYPAEDAPVSILYEDDFLLAADKPAGMLIHPSRATMRGTFANRIIGYYQKTQQPCAFHPVTRLDRDTFGIVLLAKNAHIHALLNRVHSAGDFIKIYHAIAFGTPEQDSGLIEAPIARYPLPSLLRYVSVDGKPSVTEFSVLYRQENHCKLSLRPITGRTHQLRVHCAHIGHPIIGDPQYFSQASRAFSDKIGLHSQCLCAKSLCFTHPVTNERLLIESKMDAALP